MCIYIYIYIYIFPGRGRAPQHSSHASQAASGMARSEINEVRENDGGRAPNAAGALV